MQKGRYSGRTKVMLLESSYCKPFPHRILLVKMILVNFHPGKAFEFIKFKTRWILTAPHLPRKMDMIIRSGTDQVMTQTFNKRKLSSCWSVTFVIFLVPRALQILLQIPHKRELFSCRAWSLLVSTQHLLLSISTWTALSVNATPVPQRTGRTKVMLLESSYCKPFPPRSLLVNMILVNFHPGKAFEFIKFKTGWILTAPHLPRKMDMIIRSGTD